MIQRKFSCLVQAPLILDTCTTSLINSYAVRIDYFNNDVCLTDTSIVPGNITSVMMSDYFPGHPLPDTNYTITVVAINEGGRGTSNIPACKFIFIAIYIQFECIPSIHLNHRKSTHGCIVDSQASIFQHTVKASRTD